MDKHNLWAMLSSDFLFVRSFQILSLNLTQLLELTQVSSKMKNFEAAQVAVINFKAQVKVFTLIIILWQYYRRTSTF